MSHSQHVEQKNSQKTRRLVTLRHLCSGLVLVALIFSGITADAAVMKRKKRSSKAGKTDKSLKIKESSTSSQVGLTIKEWGIAIDAVFNPQLTHLIPGYHILQIALTNNRGDPINLNPRADRWMVIDRFGKKHFAKNQLKRVDKRLWEKLPDRLQHLLKYPLVVNSGKYTMINVLVPTSVDLFQFREVQWSSKHFGKKFTLFTEYENDILVPSDKEFDIPKTTVTAREVEAKTKAIQEQQADYIKKKYGVSSQESGEVPEKEKKFDPGLDEMIILN